MQGYLWNMKRHETQALVLCSTQCQLHAPGINSGHQQIMRKLILWNSLQVGPLSMIVFSTEEPAEMSAVCVAGLLWDNLFACIRCFTDTPLIFKNN